MVRRNIDEAGHGLVARLKTPGATGFEGAGIRFRHSHGIALDLAQIGDPHASRIGDRNRAQQGCCIWVSRFAAHRVNRADLDDLAHVHHGHAVADPFDDAEVVRDEDIGKAEHCLQVEDQSQDLRPYRDIQGRHGLVEDDNLGFEDQRASDGDTLALTAGKLMRIAVLVFRPQADHSKQALASARRLAAEPRPCSLMGSAMFVPTVMRGFRDDRAS